MSEVSSTEQTTTEKSDIQKPQPEKQSKISRLQQIKKRIIGIFRRQAKEIKAASQKNTTSQETKPDLMSMSAEEANKHLLQEKINNTADDYQNMLNELTTGMPDSTKKIFADRLDAQDPVLMKTLSLHLIDRNKFNSQKTNLEIEDNNRFAKAQGKEITPLIDREKKGEKMADYMNIKMEMDALLRKQYQEKVDHRAEAAFEGKDLKLALRETPFFEPSFTDKKQPVIAESEKPRSEPVLLNQTADQEVEAALSGSK